MTLVAKYLISINNNFYSQWQNAILSFDFYVFLFHVISRNDVKEIIMGEIQINICEKIS